MSLVSRDRVFVALSALWFSVLAWRGIDHGLPRAQYAELLFHEDEAAQLLPAVATTREADRQQTDRYKQFWGWKLIPPAEYLNEVTHEKLRETNGRVEYESVNKLKWISARLLNSRVPDDQLVMHAVAQMRPQQLDFNPRFFSYGCPQIFAVAAAIAAGKVAGLLELTSDRLFYLQHPEQIRRMFLLGSLLGVLAGIVLVGLVYEAGRVLFDRAVGLSAALLTGSYPAFIVEAHHLKPFLWAGCWVLGCLLMFAVWQCRQQVRWLVAVGASAGMAAGAMYIAGAIILVPLASLAWRARRAEGGEYEWIFAVRACGIVAVTALGVFLVTNPYLVTSWQILATNIRNLSYQDFGQIRYLDVRVHLNVMRELALSLGLLGAAAATIGLLVAIVRFTQADRWLIAGFLVFYLLAFKAIVFADPVHHLVPFGAFVMLACVRWVPEVLRARSVWLRRAGELVLACLILETVNLGWRYSGLYAGVSPDIAAGEWINTHVPPGSTIGSWIHADGHRHGFPLFRYLDYRLVHDPNRNLKTLRVDLPDYLIAIAWPAIPEPLFEQPDLLRRYRLAARLTRSGTAAFPKGEWRMLERYLVEEIQVYQRIRPPEQVASLP